VKPSKEMSSWLIVLVVLLTAFITSAAMLKYKPSPEMNASYYYPPQQVAQNLSPGIATLQGNWQFAAGGGQVPMAGTQMTGTQMTGTQMTGIPMAGTLANGAPVIRAGAVAPHAERGVCTSCHTVVGSQQTPIPPILASASMPHEYRGVCFNCHRLASPGSVNTNMNPLQVATPIQSTVPMQSWPSMQYATPVAAFTPAATPQQMIPQQMIPQQMMPQTMAPQTTMPQTAAAAPVAIEGEWLGIEVTPITTLTARQYAVPEGTQGLVIAEAEAQAAVVGLKAGDVVVAINGMPTPQMTAFFQATKNGTMTQGAVEFLRKGQRMIVNLTQTVTPPATRPPNTPATGVPATMAPAGQPAAFPQGTFPTTPVAWPPAGQTMGNARTFNTPGVGQTW